MVLPMEDSLRILALESRPKTSMNQSTENLGGISSTEANMGQMWLATDRPGSASTCIDGGPRHYPTFGSLQRSPYSQGRDGSPGGSSLRGGSPGRGGRRALDARGRSSSPRTDSSALGASGSHSPGGYRGSLLKQRTLNPQDLGNKLLGNHPLLSEEVPWRRPGYEGGTHSAPPGWTSGAQAPSPAQAVDAIGQVPTQDPLEPVGAGAEGNA
mmetsp:Transcript_60406/g.136565  ORF Transcript_60406/g.136565 Transcript_60406/m.136565 type:complete len:212 (-) Transcript_60406:1-636(-)